MASRDPSYVPWNPAGTCLLSEHRLAIQGLFSDLVVLDSSLKNLLPLRDLLHTAIIATMGKAFPSFEEAVLQAGLKTCRSVATL